MSPRRLALARWWLRRRVRDGALAALVRAPAPDGAARLSGTELLSVDLETSSTDVANAEILSIGWVVIRGGCVDVGSAESRLVRPQAGVGASAVVHGLTDDRCAAGEPVRDVIERLLARLHGRALLVHHAALDKALLDRTCRALFGASLPVPVVDTLALEARRRRLRHHLDTTGSLRLGALRAAYNLPPYRAHDCLSDALAAAELFLAMGATHDAGGRLRLRDVVS